MKTKISDNVHVDFEHDSVYIRESKTSEGTRLSSDEFDDLMMTAISEGFLDPEKINKIIEAYAPVDYSLAVSSDFNVMMQLPPAKGPKK